MFCVLVLLDLCRCPRGISALAFTRVLEAKVRKGLHKIMKRMKPLFVGRKGHLTSSRDFLGYDKEDNIDHFFLLIIL
jgi:hypothetical protein